MSIDYTIRRIGSAKVGNASAYPHNTKDPADGVLWALRDNQNTNCAETGEDNA